jgi:hemoglobin-like flavoprotein
MTPAQIALIRVSFAAVKPIADTAAALFYGRLFDLHPSLRPMFKRDLEEQGRMLMQVIGVAVASLDRVETLAPVLHNLGRRHGDYGVRDDHYGAVAEALLWTLQTGLGDKFTPAVRDAWVTVYGVLAGTMQAGAAAARARKVAA